MAGGKRKLAKAFMAGPERGRLMSEYIPTPEEALPDPPPAWLDLLEDGASIMGETIPPLVEVIRGFLAEMSKLVIASGSKSYKTWLTMYIALCVSHGLECLGRDTMRGRVLYVNLELKPKTFKARLQIIAKALGAKLDPAWFLHLPLRGKIAGKSPSEVISEIIKVAQHVNASMVILDPVYKLNTEGDENSSRDQTVLFNQIDRITTEAQCTVILNDHFGKGNQSEKDPLDAIRGSSAKGGDVDAAMVLRNHEVQGCFRVDMIHRELPPVEPFCIGWNFPLMELRTDLDPYNMKKASGGRIKEHSEIKLLSVIKDTTEKSPISVSEWAKLLKVQRTTLSGYTPNLRKQGFIATTGHGTTARQYITNKGLELLQGAAA
jgi:hypothetical protein